MTDPDRYDAYTCRVCNGMGMRPNETPNLIDPRLMVVCHCDGIGQVLVLHGFRAPWYAGERLPDQVGIKP